MNPPSLSLGPARGEDAEHNSSELSSSDPQQQNSSFSFLQLPAELRLEIYDILFTSTRLSHGRRFVNTAGGLSEWTTIIPGKHSLALLRVNRQIFQETRVYWPRRVLVNFENGSAMLHKLLGVNNSISANLRHVRTYMGLGDISGLGPVDPLRFLKVWAGLVKVLSSLRLDTFTVLGPFIPPLGISLLTRLLREGQGWRELRFVTPNRAMLCCAYPGESSRIKLWKSIVRERDEHEGCAAGSSTLTVYHALDAHDTLGIQPPIFCPERRRVRSLNPLRADDVCHLSHGDWGRAMMVVVRWGPNVNIGGHGGDQTSLEVYSEIMGVTHPHERIQEDNYTHVDEY
jgi:hypothetical protein